MDLVNSNRRDFIKGIGAVTAATALGTGFLLKACSPGQRRATAPTFLDQAPEGQVLKAGLIGCGSRGTGAAINFLDAGPGLEITALGDVFADRLNGCRAELKAQRNVEVADEKCFLGFDSYQKVIDSGVDVVLLVTPPFFRPAQFEAAVRAKKHVFMEKPVAVDPFGVRIMRAASRMADGLGLKVVAGTQRRHQRDYLTTYEQIKNGAIGDIIAANCYWNQPQLWFVNRQPGWNDMEAMLRDWVNWTWLSGDHIVEQHIHNYDVVSWFKGKHPVKALSFGARLRRPTGDQYDFFSTDFVYDDGTHLHSMCRQINNSSNLISEHIVGTKGTSNCQNSIKTHAGEPMWDYVYPPDEEGNPSMQLMKNPFEQEMVHLVAAIRNNTPLNQADDCAMSSLVGIMGRISAYTGKEVTMEEMLNSNMRIGPEILAFGDVNIPKLVQIPGV
jgi:predicted dehydrogenase